MPSVPPRLHPTWMRAKLERLDELLRQEPAHAKAEIAKLSFAKMVMGLRPTLHHEIRLSFPLRRRPDTSMVCGTSSPSQN